MKKLVVLLLLLGTLLGLSMPAMAYTNNAAGSFGSQFKVDLYLVDYDMLGDIGIGMIKQKPSRNTYAKNEVIAAIGSIEVPANDSLSFYGFTSMQFTSNNMSFDVVENLLAGSRNRYELINNVPVASWETGRWTLRDDDTTLFMDLSGNRNVIPVSGSKRTYSWLVFGKVLKNGASISLEFNRQVEFAPVNGGWISQGIFASTGSNAASYLILSDDFLVIKQRDGNYFIFDNNTSRAFSPNSAPSGAPLFRIEIGRRNKTERLYMYTSGATGPQYRVLVEPSARELIFVCIGNTVRGKKEGDQIEISDKNYKALRAFYANYFEADLGFSAFNEGNTLTDRDWIKIASRLSLSKTVKIPM